MENPLDSLGMKVGLFFSSGPTATSPSTLVTGHRAHFDLDKTPSRSFHLELIRLDYPLPFPYHQPQAPKEDLEFPTNHQPPSFTRVSLLQRVAIFTLEIWMGG